MTVVPDVTDAAGRHGLAVAFDSHWVAAGRPEEARQEWIFDPVTLRYMGESTVSGGVVTSATAVLDQGFVDRLGELSR